MYEYRYLHIKGRLRLVTVKHFGHLTIVRIIR